MSRRSRFVVAFLVWWAALFWTAMLLLGEWAPLNLMAAGGIGMAAAAAAIVVQALGPIAFAFRLRWLRGAATVPTRVVVDFALIAWVLVRALAARRVPEGVFRTRPFDVGEADHPLAAGWRAWIGAAAGFSPNAYVVELDAERQAILVHDLVPRRASERPAA